MRTSWIFLILVSTFQYGAAGFLYAQEGNCDPNLIQPKKNPLGYRERGDRCEGVYVQPLSGSSNLQVVSLAYHLQYNLASGQHLRIEWLELGSGDVQIRAQALKPRTYYRMDTKRPAHEGSYDWPIGLLYTLGLKQGELGAVGWTRHIVAGVTQDVYLPLVIFQSMAQVNSRDVVLKLRCGVELAEVYITLSLISSDGEISSILKKREPLGYGSYPRQRPLPVVIRDLPNSGVYCLEVSAGLKKGGSTSKKLWFYHSLN